MDPEDTIEPDLLTLLDDLCLRIQNKKTHEDTSGVCIPERYKYMIEHSEFKKDCGYAKKYKDIFLRSDYEEIKQIFLDVLVQYRLIEGNEFGR
jgi:hypothetical protein